MRRDVKPANIIVRPDGQAVIVDFGLAKAPAGGEGTLTQSGQRIGTVRYMSSEQARGGSRGVDARSDVYSIGVVLFRLLGGIWPQE